MLCLPFREQTEAGTLWSLLSTVGLSPRPEPAASHARAPGSPEVLPPAGPLVSREVSVSKPSVRIAVVDGRQRSTARTQNPLQLSFLIFFPPLHSASPHPGSSLSLFMIKSLGKKASLPPSRTDLPGEVRMELPHQQISPQSSC